MQDALRHNKVAPQIPGGMQQASGLLVIGHPVNLGEDGMVLWHIHPGGTGQGPILDDLDAVGQADQFQPEHREGVSPKMIKPFLDVDAGDDVRLAGIADVLHAVYRLAIDGAAERFCAITHSSELLSHLEFTSLHFTMMCVT